MPVDGVVGYCAFPTAKVGGSIGCFFRHGQFCDGELVTYDSERRVLRWHRVSYPIARAQERIREAGLPNSLAERLAYGA